MVGDKFMILGYYNRCNLGDDIFSYVLKRYFEVFWPRAEIIIKNTDDVNKIADDVTAVICGGGDLINSYFMSRILKLTENLSCPIYALGVGIPYPQMIDRGYLDGFDYIIHRNHTDAQLLLNKYGPLRVKFAPDLAFYLPKTPQKKITHYLDQALGLTGNRFIRFKAEMQEKMGPNRIAKKIGIFLARPIRRVEDPEAYDHILEVLADFVADLASKKKHFWKPWYCETLDLNEYQIFLIPCGTKEGSNKEDDRLINADLLAKIHQRGEFNNIYQVDQAIPHDEIIALFKSLWLTISTRFHPHVFSILAGTPVLSVYCSRKVENLMTETGLIDYTVKMPVDPETLHPIDLDKDKLSSAFDRIVKHYKCYQVQLQVVNRSLEDYIPDLIKTLNNLLAYKIKHFMPERVSVFTSYKMGKLDLVANNLIQCMYPGIEDLTKLEYVTNLVNGDKRIVDLIPGSIKSFSKEDKIFLSEVIIFTLTRGRCSRYNWGLIEQLFMPEYDLRQSVEYILIEEAKLNEKYLPAQLENDLPLCFRKFNMQYLHQHSLEGYHRSGWNYVMKMLAKFHRPDGIIFDSYLDRTFGWDKDFYQKLGILPFKQSWTGVIHHTPNSEYSQNNLKSVFEDQVFIDSLNYCKGLIVLSKFLKQWIERKLDQIGIARVPIIVVYHPTESVSTTFKMDYFMNNTNKKVIQIGAWLRDSYAIYRLPTSVNYQKCALRGKNMGNHFPKPNYLNKIVNSLLEIGCDKDDACHQLCRTEIVCNKYIVGLIDMIEDNHQSVEIIEMVNNEEFDQLLSENVVFINLVDASAVNTVIECIMRNTPILVNRLPAVEEYLGRCYPLYYDTYVEALDLLDDFSKIYRAHKYLTRMNKCKFSLDNFYQTIIKSPIFMKL